MKVYYTITVWSDTSTYGKTLKNKYKRDKNAVLKLMSIRDDYRFIMINEEEVYDSGVRGWGPFISWDREKKKLMAHGVDNPYSRNRDKYHSDITPWYILAEREA